MERAKNAFDKANEYEAAAKERALEEARKQ